MPFLVQLSDLTYLREQLIRHGQVLGYVNAKGHAFSEQKSSQHSESKSAIPPLATKLNQEEKDYLGVLFDLELAKLIKEESLLLELQNFQAIVAAMKAAFENDRERLVVAGIYANFIASFAKLESLACDIKKRNKNENFDIAVLNETIKEGLEEISGDEVAAQRSSHAATRAGMSEEKEPESKLDAALKGFFEKANRERVKPDSIAAVPKHIAKTDNKKDVQMFLLQYGAVANAQKYLEQTVANAKRNVRHLQLKRIRTRWEISRGLTPTHSIAPKKQRSAWSRFKTEFKNNEWLRFAIYLGGGVTLAFASVLTAGLVGVGIAAAFAAVGASSALITSAVSATLWTGMAMTAMAGSAFGCVLTLLDSLYVKCFKPSVTNRSAKAGRDQTPPSPPATHVSPIRVVSDSPKSQKLSIPVSAVPITIDNSVTVGASPGSPRPR